MKKYTELIVLFVSVLIIKTITSHTSVLNGIYGGDVGIFMYFGQVWANGGMAYIDVFDHKGPLHFLFYAIGSMLYPGKWGILILSTINMTLVFKLALNISRLLLCHATNKVHYAIIASTAFVYIFSTDPGCSEEFSLFFIFLPLYLLLKFIKSGISIKQHPLINSIIYGACIAAIFLIRANNACVCAGIIVGFIIILVKEKHYKTLLINSIYCLVGFVFFTIPWILYFYFNDALYEMIYATFLFNLKYKSISQDAFAVNFRILKNILLLLPCIYAIFISVVYDKKHKTIYRYFIVSAAIITTLTFFSGNNFLHYFVNVIPFYLISLIFTYDLSNKKSMLTIVKLSTVFIIPFYQGIITTTQWTFVNMLLVIHSFYPPIMKPLKIIGQHERFSNFMFNRSDEINNILSIIPKNEHNSIYSYDTMGRQGAFIENNVIVNCKYCIFNEVHAAIDKKVADEIDNYHTTTNVKWIITSLLDDEIKRESMKELLKKYDKVYMGEYSSLSVFKRKDIDN